MIYRLRERFLGPFIRNRRTWFMKPAFEPQMWVRMTRCGSVLTGSSYLWKGCSWREPGAPRTQAPERRRSELQHPPTPGRVRERERRTEIDIKRSGTISFTTSGMLLPAVVHFKANKHSIPNTDSIHVVPFYSSKIFLFSCSRSDSSVFDFFFFFRAGSCCVSRTETRPADSCTQGDLKRSFHSALKRRGQRWISVSETGRGGLC